MNEGVLSQRLAIEDCIAFGTIVLQKDVRGCSACPVQVYVEGLSNSRKLMPLQFCSAGTSL